MALNLISFTEPHPLADAPSLVATGFVGALLDPLTAQYGLDA